MIVHKNIAPLLFLLAVPVCSVFAEEGLRYITDDLEVTIHRKMTLNSEVVAQLKSGTPVRILKTNRDEGFVMVATKNEKVGWMLETFLMDEPAGRQKYQTLKTEHDQLKAEFDLKLQERTANLSRELDQLKKISKRPLALQKENQQLKDLLEKERAQTEVIKQENRAFKSIHKDRHWLITGALIAVGSLVLGLIVTKIPWRRRKSWGEL